MCDSISYEYIETNKALQFDEAEMNQGAVGVREAGNAKSAGDRKVPAK